MKQLLVLFIMLTPFASQAVKWVERGNGGFVLKCPNSERRQVFDLYEAQQRFQELDTKHLTSVDERVQYLIGKIEKLNPSRAALYRGWYASFMEESQFRANVDLTPVPDIGFGAKPKNCDLELAVFQRKPDALNSKRYVISLDIWNSLDNLHKAALIMHEIIYRELIEVGEMHGTSESTRYFNSVLHSEKFEMPSKEYLSLLQNLRFPRADYNGYTIRLMYAIYKENWRMSNIEFHQNGALKTAFLANDGIILPGNTRHIQCLPWDTTIQFFDDGTISDIQIRSTYASSCETMYTYQEGSTKIQFRPQMLSFYKTGQVNKVSGVIDFRDTPKGIVINGTLITRDHVSKFTDQYEMSLELNPEGNLTDFVIEQVAHPCYRKEQSKIEFRIGINTPALHLNVQSFAQDVAKLPLCK